MDKQFRSYLTISGILKGKRKLTSLEVPLEGLDLLNPSCPIRNEVKASRELFKAITSEVVNQYGYIKVGSFIIRDDIPTQSYLFEQLEKQIWHNELNMR